MRSHTLALVVLSLSACGRSSEGADRLGPRFAAAARLPTATGTSEGLAAAERAAKEEDAEAIALLVAAREAGERLPGEACLGGLIAWHTLATMAIGEPDVTDMKRLEAAAWLARRVQEDRPTLVGAVLGVSLTHDVLSRLKDADLPLTPAIRATLPPDDLLRRTFAREALCVEQQIAHGLDKPAKDEPLTGAIVDNERRMVVAFFEKVMDGVDAAATSTDVVRALERAGEEAATSDSELVRMVFTSRGYDDLEQKRRAIAELAQALPTSKAMVAPEAVELAGGADKAAPADDAPIVLARARVADAATLRRELEGSGMTLVYDPEAKAFVVGGVTRGSIGELLGLRDGDRLEAIGTDFAHEAHASGQTGHAFIVDGLGGPTNGATVRRGDVLRRITWNVE